jgi:GTP-binding protein YchF
MKLGIIGLPQAGKTTIFNALTGGDTPVGQMTSGGRFEINQATVNVPDARVDWLVGHYNPKKITNAQINFADIAGMQGDKTAISGALLNALAQMEGLVHVVRAFANSQVPHPLQSVNPARDIATIDDEFLLNDLAAVEKRLEKLQIELKKGGGRDKGEIAREITLFERMQAHLNEGFPLRTLDLSDEEKRGIGGFGLLSLKPLLIVLNTGDTPATPEETLQGKWGNHAPESVVALQGKIEMEIAQISGEDQALFLAEYGLSEPSLSRMIQISYRVLGLQSFFTVGPDEVRAWTVRRGATAPEAAGRIHTDLQAGFIRAEVMNYHDLVTYKDEAGVRSAGKWSLQGKDYIVQDGDILNIRFSPPSKK